jgi:serine/threonine protein phosphatase 1
VASSSLAIKDDFIGPNSGPKIDRLTYAIGDIHGRFDLFKRMIQRIRQDIEMSGGYGRIVLLGDYIDRGYESAKVLGGIISLRQQNWCEVVELLGNHEQVLLKFLADPSIGPEWFRFGGFETVRSFGVPLARDPESPEEWKLVCARLNAAIPPEYLSLLKSMKCRFDAGDYVFVHAGVDPDVDLSRQTQEALLWIREPFLRVRRACEKAVVHGHTTSEEVVNEVWRIGLDTGAYATGVLSAVRLESCNRQVIQISSRRALAA